LNARLHDLATAVRSEPGADAEIERMASAIVDEAGRPDLIEFARQVAEAEMDLRRIRRARVTRSKLPDMIVTSFRWVTSPNKKLFMKAVSYETRRKEFSAIMHLTNNDLNGHDSAVASKGTAGAPEEIEITPAMIEAAADVIYNWPSFDVPEVISIEVAREALLAGLSAR
jgi:hypothetical protein